MRRPHHRRVLLGRCEPEVVAGATYVDPIDGSDSNDGSSAALALKTIPTLSATDVIMIRPYAEISISSSVGMKDSTTLRSWTSNHPAIIRSSDTYGVLSAARNTVTLQDLHVYGGTSAGIRIADNSATVTITRVSCYDGVTGIHVSSTTPVTLTDCFVSNMQQHGMLFQGHTGLGGLDSLTLTRCAVRNFGMEAAGGNYDGISISGPGAVTLTHCDVYKDSPNDSAGSHIDISAGPTSVTDAISGNVNYCRVVNGWMGLSLSANAGQQADCQVTFTGCYAENFDRACYEIHNSAQMTLASCTALNPQGTGLAGHCFQSSSEVGAWTLAINNCTFTQSAAGYVMYIYETDASMSGDNNTYAGSGDVTAFSRVASGPSEKTFAQWQTAYSMDASSTYTSS